MARRIVLGLHYSMGKQRTMDHGKGLFGQSFCRSVGHKKDPVRSSLNKLYHTQQVTAKKLFDKLYSRLQV